jgi:hypothetical protein
MNNEQCAFCDGKEVAIAKVTDRNYPIGDNCWNKAIDKGVTWDTKASLSELRMLIRKRTKRVPDASS